MVTTRSRWKQSLEENNGGDSSSDDSPSDEQRILAPLENPTSKNILVARNLAIVILFAFILETLVSEYEQGRPFLDLTMLRNQFQGSRILIAGFVNTVYIFLACIVVPAITRVRRLLFSLPLYLMFQFCLVVFPHITLKYVLQKPTAVQGALVGLQMILLIMKTHSYFFFERDYLFLNQDQENEADDDENGKKGDTISFFWFVCFPTLTYRRKYARTKHIRWGSAIQHALLAVLDFFALYVMTNYYIFPEVARIAERGILRSILAQSVVCLVVWFLVFFGIWHAYLCFTAEVTRFADRSHFYRTWWEVVHFRKFWASWNLIVATWIQRDLYVRMQNVGFSRWVSLVTVMLVAGLFHELALYYTFGTITFWITGAYMVSIGVGMATSSDVLDKSMIGNLLLWIFLVIGAPGVILIHGSEYVHGYVPLFGNK